MKPIAYIYTCRNPGQVSLLWAHQPPPFGHGWIDVKRVGLVREDEAEVLRKALQDLYDETTRINNPQWLGSPMQQQCEVALNGARGRALPDPAKLPHW